MILMHLQKRHTLLPVSSIRKATRAASAIRPLFPVYSAYSELSGKRILTHPCIFLDNREKLCRIYEVRPLICRLYGYYSKFGDCLSAKNQITFVKPEIETRVSAFLGDTITDSGEVKPPLAAPLVYWFGGKPPISDKHGFQELFITSHEGNISDYITLSVHQDFSDWFAI